MNARDESSSSSSSMGTPRVSARTRFAPSTPTVATASPGAGSMHDYGNNDNYRVVVRKSSILSKGGINGNNDNGGGDLAAGGSLVKGALKKNASANSGSGAIASGAGASANKDRPWRNNSSSSSSAPPRANYDGNYDEDTVEFSASSLATPPPPRNHRRLRRRLHYPRPRVGGRNTNAIPIWKKNLKLLHPKQSYV